ncbi:hypothetical protein EP7_000464 [Isosphaeraceae bacterium EP7]
MESTLHRQLKDRYGDGGGGRSEVALAGYRVDALAADGTVVEVQTASLAPLRGKLLRLLVEHRVRVVKPLVLKRWVVNKASRGGADLSSRLSPMRGRLADVFEDLIGLVGVFPHPNLTVDVLGVEVDEVRLTRKRKPGYTVIDRRLRALVSSTPLLRADDLWSLLPTAPDGPFTTGELAEALGTPRHEAQRVAYTLRHCGAADLVSKSGNSRIYARAGGTRALPMVGVLPGESVESSSWVGVDVPG